jgi:hypothetical protein
MILAGYAVSETDDLGRGVGGVAPRAGFCEIATAGVAGLEIAEDRVVQILLTDRDTP